MSDIEIATVIRANGERAIVATFTPDEWAALGADLRSQGYDRAVAIVRELGAKWHDLARRGVGASEYGEAARVIIELLEAKATKETTP